MGHSFTRILQIPDLTKQSVFLWGPRKVGKSTYIKEHFKSATYIDLLKSDVFSEYASRPALLRERYSSSTQGPIVIDEIQKCPQLLDEIHWLIENKNIKFLLTGSSARKLRKHHANLLGGRTWRREMRPLCFAEVKDWNLEKVFASGLLPSHYTSLDPREDLRSYIADYLKEEVAMEASVRNLPAFSDFLRVASLTNAELLNYANVAREVGVSPKVVKGYFEILEDTLLGFRISPWKSSKNRRLVETEKFYFFDLGVSNFLAKRHVLEGSAEFGKSFEHLMLMELMAYKSYISPDMDITFWRTSNKQEVDFILNDKEVAIEIKSSSRTHSADLKGLTYLSEDGPIKKRILISQDKEPKILSDRYGPVSVIPWRMFLEMLWSKEII